MAGIFVPFASVAGGFGIFRFGHWMGGNRWQGIAYLLYYVVHPLLYLYETWGRWLLLFLNLWFIMETLILFQCGHVEM